MAIKTKHNQQEIQLQNSAETEIMKFKDSIYLWCKHVLGVTLDPHQCVLAEDIDGHANTMIVGSRRIRKSFTVAMKFLMEAATKPKSEVNIHAPALEQSKRDLKYMTDAILGSEILMAYIENRLGQGLGREYVEFVNRSVIQAKGQASSTDGLGATHQWLEEFDDMDWETFLTRIYPTGSMIKTDYDYGAIEGCRRVVTGTIKGNGNLRRLEEPDSNDNLPIQFHVCPKYDCWDGVAWGIIPEADIIFARDVLMTPAQFARTYLCLYVESKDYYPSSLIRGCQAIDLAPIVPRSGFTYRGRHVTFGMDFEGHGSEEDASCTSITFWDRVGLSRYRWLCSYEWPAGSSPKRIREQVVELCRFFRPAKGMGDAYGANDIYEINRALYKAGVSTVNVDRLQNKEGKGGWDDFFFQPIRFEGRTKHAMYENLKILMDSWGVAWPCIVQDHPNYRFLEKFHRQMENIQAKKTAHGYNSYKMIRPALGDDILDSAAAGLYAQGMGDLRTTRAAGGAIAGAGRGRIKDKVRIRNR